VGNLGRVEKKNVLKKGVGSQGEGGGGQKKGGGARGKEGEKLSRGGPINVFQRENELEGRLKS